MDIYIIRFALDVYCFAKAVYYIIILPQSCIAAYRDTDIVYCAPCGAYRAPVHRSGHVRYYYYCISIESTEHMNVKHMTVQNSHWIITPVRLISVLNTSWLLYWEITRNFQIANTAAVSLVGNISVQTFILAAWLDGGLTDSVCSKEHTLTCVYRATFAHPWSDTIWQFIVCR